MLLKRAAKLGPPAQSVQSSLVSLFLLCQCHAWIWYKSTLPAVLALAATRTLGCPSESLERSILVVSSKRVIYWWPIAGRWMDRR